MPDTPLELNGLDGANPLGFLAALGTLALCERIGLDPRMSWTPYANSHRPRLWVKDSTELAERFAACLVADLTDSPPTWCAGTVIKRPASDYRSLACQAAIAASASDQTAVRFFAAFACDLITDDKSTDVTPSRLSFANGQSGKLLLRDYRDLVNQLSGEKIEMALFNGWKNTEPCKTFRWEPRDLRLYALRAEDPGASTVYSTPAGNVLAFWALTMLPSFPSSADELSTQGFTRQAARRKDGDCFSWPMWESALGHDAIASILSSSNLCAPEVDHVMLRAIGVTAIYRSRRINYQKGLYFSQAQSI